MVKPYDWKVGDNASTFSVDSGMIKVNGNTAHLFYEGAVNHHSFKNFEFKADVMTKPHLSFLGVPFPKPI